MIDQCITHLGALPSFDTVSVVRVVILIAPDVAGLGVDCRFGVPDVLAPLEINTLNTNF